MTSTDARTETRIPVLRPIERFPGLARRCLVAIAVLAACPGVRADAPSSDQPKDEKKQDLARKLIRQAKNQDDDDMMAEIMRLMNAAAKRLEIDFDAGEETQAIQNRIAEQLDDAIKLAAAQRRPAPQRQPRAAGEKRRRQNDEQTSRKRKAGASEESGDDDEQTTKAAGGAVESGTLSGDLTESRRSWGHLPQREREEVIQGINEDYVQRYREWIERYYRALQEAEE